MFVKILFLADLFFLALFLMAAIVSLQSEICASSITDIVQAVVNGADGCLFCYGHAKIGKDILCSFVPQHVC